VDVVGSELVGLAPTAAFTETARYYLAAPALAPDAAVEMRVLGALLAADQA
jgi:glutamate formiminotransferase